MLVRAESPHPSGTHPRLPHTPSEKEPRIVALGGGTGLPAVLEGIRSAYTTTRTAKHACDWPTAIVTVMDDGGSSGRLRESLGVLPPGDIRNCLAALVRQPSDLSAVLNQRMPCESGQVGHPIGNLILAALTGTEGDLLQAIRTLSNQIGVAGRVLPATLESVHLQAVFEDGSDARGETAIAAKRARIAKLTLERGVPPVPEALAAIVNADLVVIGPGSLYTSVLPNLLVNGVAATISAVTAPRVYVANLMTEPGETDGYSIADHLRVIREHTGFDLFDYVLVNNRPLPADAIALYAAEGSQVTSLGEDIGRWSRGQIVVADVAAVSASGQIRHDPVALGEELMSIRAAHRVTRERH